MENNIVSHKCPICSKTYKNTASLSKHAVKCAEAMSLLAKKNEILSQVHIPPVGNGSVTPTSTLNNKATAQSSNNSTVTSKISSGNSSSTDQENNNSVSSHTSGNNYDISMSFLEGNRIQVEVKKQSDDDDDGEQVLKEILKPQISETYQDEIDKLEDLIKMVKIFAIPNNDNDKDKMIEQLKNTIAVMMIQAKNLIKEMKQMSYRNNYYKNNIMLASYVLDKCRKDVPGSEEEFEQMFKLQTEQTE